VQAVRSERAGMRTSKRSEIRAIVLFTMASVVVVWAATVAYAKPINSVAELKSSCAKGNGIFWQSDDGQSGICEVKGGDVICKNHADGPKCQGYRNEAQLLIPVRAVSGADGVTLTSQEVPTSQTWKQNLSVASLRYAVCSNLGGQFVGSADGTLGTCTTPTATLLCKNTGTGSICVGLADTKRHANTLSKQAKAAVRGRPRSTARTSTTATTAPTTTISGSTATSTPKPTLPRSSITGAAGPSRE